MENYKIVNESFSEKEKGSKETVFALANGYMGVRGTIEFCESELSGTFIQGVFNKGDMSVPELVNLPDPLSINVYLINEVGLQRVNFNSCNLLDFSEELDMRRGVFLYSVSLKTENGYRVNIDSERFISWKNKHRWAAKYWLNVEKFSGRVLIENTINNNVYNNSMNPLDRTNHFGHFRSLNFQNGIGMVSYLTDSNKKIIQMCSTVPENFQMNRLKYKEELNRPVEILSFDYEKNREYCFTK
jgi:trehalose/maltose hydrolase-like predicted phosphorylase